MATVPTSGDTPLPGRPRRRPVPLIQPAPPQVAQAEGGVVAHARVRPFVIYGVGTLLLAINAYFGTYAYIVAQALLWTQTSLQRGPVAMLFAVVALNALFARAAKKYAINSQELAILYSMLCIGTCAAGWGFVQVLINQIAAPFYFATSANGFAERVLPHVPTWLAPHDPEVYNGFFRGNSSLYSAAVMRGWAVPVLAWSAFIIAVFWILICATTLVRRQWVEEERLTFPLVLLPLEMIGVGGDGQTATPFWRNRLMWAGFILAGLLESVNFLNFLYPSIPTIPIKPSMGANHLEAMFVARPWNTMGILTLAFYPFAIGIGYLLSLDVSFSCWSLYLLSKLSIVACAALGLSDGGSGPANRAPFVREQSVGAFVGIALFSLWMARRALATAWQEMKRPTGRDANELMSFRLALVGGGVGILFMIGFLIAAGLSWQTAIIFVFAYLCFALTLARIVSEAGAGWAWGPEWTASQFTTDAVGATHLSPQNLTMLVGYTSWMTDMRDNPMPQAAAALKIAPGAGLSPRGYLKPLLFAIVFGTLLAFWAHLDIYYTYGAATAKTRQAVSGATGSNPAKLAATLIVTPTLQDTTGLLAAGGAVLLAVGLSVLRQMFPWWPIHPLGYALANTRSMEYMWCPFFIAWLAKLITLRYGGIRAYRLALPFFLGLILGDYVVPALWGVFGMMTSTQQYLAFPH